MRLYFLLGLFALANPIFEHQPEQAGFERPICAIKSSPALFNGKLVEVSGYATHGADNSMFEDPTCFWGKQYAGTWMEYGGTAGVRGHEARPLMVQGVGVVLVHDALFEKSRPHVAFGSGQGRVGEGDGAGAVLCDSGDGSRPARRG